MYIGLMMCALNDSGDKTSKQYFFGAIMAALLIAGHGAYCLYA
jgi:hypothetical protein